jgi:hypothetical protein
LNIYANNIPIALVWLSTTPLGGLSVLIIAMGNRFGKKFSANT